MKGKILEIKPSGNWESESYGTMYTYAVQIKALNDLVFEGEANAKSETIEGLPYKIGEDVEFEHTENTHPGRTDKLKIKKEGGYSVGEKSESKNRGFALRYATDLAIARMTTPDFPGDHNTTKDIIEQADRFVAWLDS